MGMELSQIAVSGRLRFFALLGESVDFFDRVCYNRCRQFCKMEGTP